MAETNEERLERIKGGLVKGSDIPFIVEGFKKLSSLSLQMQGGALAHKMIVGYVKELEEENKRLRVAIVLALNEHKWNNEESARILEQALEGVK